jgi:hypothetical protein
MLKSNYDHFANRHDRGCGGAPGWRDGDEDEEELIALFGRGDEPSIGKLSFAAVRSRAGWIVVI